MQRAVAALCVIGILLTASVVRGSDAKETRAARDVSPAPPGSATAAPAAPARSQSPSGDATTTGETLEEIAARVRRRLAAEQARPVRREPAPTPAPTPEPRYERVTLVWRPSLVWPSTLTGDAPVAADDARVTLSWEDASSR